MPVLKEAASNMGTTADEVTETTIRPEEVKKARKDYYKVGGYLNAANLTPAEFVDVLEHEHEPLDMRPITNRVQHVIEHMPHPHISKIEPTDKTIAVKEKPRPLIFKLFHNISDLLFSPFKKHPHTS